MDGGGAVAGLLLVLMLLTAIVLGIVALFRLKSAEIDDLSRVVWVVVILAVPILGSIALFIVDPGSQAKGGKGAKGG
jgi:uncharacterized membrane protein